MINRPWFLKRTHNVINSTILLITRTINLETTSIRSNNLVIFCDGQTCGWLGDWKFVYYSPLHFALSYIFSKLLRIDIYLFALR